MKARRLGLGIWTSFCLCGQNACASVDAVVAATQRAETLALASDLKRESIPTATFTITTFARVSAQGQPLHVYFEGDGRAWESRTVPAANPTPRRALGLQLAARDAAPNVVYIARPCEFTATDLKCSATYWTDRRYSEEVVAAVNQVVSHFAAQVPGKPLELIGYSGGGAIAVLIAARRTDVVSLRTVAGDLDTDEVMRLHAVDPLRNSLNPILAARAIDHIPQVHFSGGADHVVPPAIAARFVAAVASTCAHEHVIATLSHEGHWAQIWPGLLAEPVDC